MHLLDTDVCVDLLRGRDDVLEQVEPFEAAGPLAVTSVTTHELIEGAHRSQAVDRNLRRINAFLKAFEILPYDEDAARIGGELAGDLANQGTPIGDLDTVIAATALANSATILTRNARHFRAVEGLNVHGISTPV